MSDKFLAVVKLKTSEEVLAQIEMSPQGDVMSLDCPAMIGESSFTRKPGISIIKIEPWIKTGREKTYIVEMSNIITICEISDKDVIDTEDREQVRTITEKAENAIIIASYGPFSTGINIKNLHNVIFASPNKSKIRNLQSIGRVLRKGDNKIKATLFDIADDITYGSSKNYTLNHMMERVKIYNEENFNYEMLTIPLKKCQINF